MRPPVPLQQCGMCGGPLCMEAKLRTQASRLPAPATARAAERSARAEAGHRPQLPQIGRVCAGKAGLSKARAFQFPRGGGNDQKGQEAPVAWSRPQPDRAGGRRGRHLHRSRAERHGQHTEDPARRGHPQCGPERDLASEVPEQRDLGPSRHVPVEPEAGRWRGARRRSDRPRGRLPTTGISRRSRRRPTARRARRPGCSSSTTTRPMRCRFSCACNAPSAS